MNNSNTKPANITATLGAGSTASPFYFMVNISQKLCHKTCADEVPIFNPVFTLIGTSSVGTSQYVATIKVEGVISYVPCGCGSCNTRTQIISQVFTIPFYSTTAPESVTIGKGETINSVDPVACAHCTRTFVSETPVTLTIA